MKRNLNLKVELAPVEVKELSKETPYQINPIMAKNKAKELYIIHNYSQDRISSVLGIPTSTLDSWIFDGVSGHIAWKEERDIYLEKVQSKLKEDKAEVLTEIMGLGVEILKKGLMRIAEKDDFSMAELRKVSDIVYETNKHLNLEQGKPTNISATFEGTQDELTKLLKELSDIDPFLDYSKIEQ